jgi:integrase/recombinase XerD
MKELVEEFLNYLSVERGLSDNTISAYRADLYKYAQYAEAKKRRLHFQEITRSDIRDYMMSQKDNGLSASSISRNLVSIRVFHRFLQREGYNKRFGFTQALETPSRGLIGFRGGGDPEKAEPQKLDGHKRQGSA